MISGLTISNMTTDLKATNEPIKPAIVEDQRDIREGLASLIGFTQGFSCTGSYSSMEEALDITDLLKDWE